MSNNQINIFLFNELITLHFMHIANLRKKIYEQPQIVRLFMVKRLILDINLSKYNGHFETLSGDDFQNLTNIFAQIRNNYSRIIHLF